MDGYGTMLSVRNGTLQEYQTTAVSYLKGDSAQRTSPGTYITPDGAVLAVRTQGGRDRGSMRSDGSVGDRNLRRIPELPYACTRPAPKGPLAAFDVFWQSFEENYPFFSIKGIDWHAVRDQYRPRVRAGTTRDELYAVFSEMAKPLYDAHVAVQDGDRVYAQVRPGTVVPTEELDTKVKRFIVARDLKNARNLQDFANGADHLRRPPRAGRATCGSPASADTRAMAPPTPPSWPSSCTSTSCWCSRSWPNRHGRGS